MQPLTGSLVLLGVAASGLKGGEPPVLLVSDMSVSVESEKNVKAMIVRRNTESTTMTRMKKVHL